MTLVTNFDDFIRYYGGLVQDDYRVTSKLTLNIGMRLEHESGVQEENNKLIVGFNPTFFSPLSTSGFPVAGGVEYAGVNGNQTQTGNALNVKPAPRFGFAYSLGTKTLIRGGYGILWAPTFFNFHNAIGYSQTTSIVASTNGNFAPATSLSPNGLLQPTGNSLGLPSGIGQAINVFNSKTQSAGYVQQYSLEVQRQTPAGIILTVGALGSHSLDPIESGQNIDRVYPPYFPLGSALTQSVANPFYNHGGVGTLGTADVSRAQLLLPFPQYTSMILGNSDTAPARYYSFYVRGQRRLANGLSLLASYTWSRRLDNVIGLNLASASQIASVSGAQNAYNLNGEWSLFTQDVPSRFSTAIIYGLPFGRGKPFPASNCALNWVVGGWSVNAFGNYPIRVPLSVTQPNNNNVIGAKRPNATGIPVGTSGSEEQRLNDWINPAAFSQAPEFTFGDTSRFLDVRGPGLFSWDLSAFKGFVIKERVNAQFRSEAFNRDEFRVFQHSQHDLHQPDVWSDYQPGEHTPDATAWREGDILKS